MFSFTLIGVGAMSLQETAPAPMLGQVAALFAGVLNIIGAGLGPVAVGVITDYVLRDPSAIGTAILATCVSASVIGLLLFRSGFATYAATRAEATDWRVSTAAAGTPGAANSVARTNIPPMATTLGYPDPAPPGGEPVRDSECRIAQPGQPSRAGLQTRIAEAAGPDFLCQTTRLTGLGRRVLLGIGRREAGVWACAALRCRYGHCSRIGRGAREQRQP